MPLFFVIHQRPIDIGVHDQAFQIVLREQLRILAPAERRNLPPGLAIVGLHLRQALNDKFFPNFVRALDLLTKLGAKGSLAELRCDAHGAHRFQFVGSAFRLDILGDNLINGLRAGGERKESDRRGHYEEKTEDACDLPKRSPPQLCFHELTPPQWVAHYSKRKEPKRPIFITRTKLAALS